MGKAGAFCARAVLAPNYSSPPLLAGEEETLSGNCCGERGRHHTVNLWTAHRRCDPAFYTFGRARDSRSANQDMV